MASRKLVRDFFLSSRFIHRQLLISQQVSNSSARLRLLQANGYLGNRQFSVFNEFLKKIKGEVNRKVHYQEFQQSVKELKEKAEELKGVTEDLKVRTKQTTEKLYRQVDGVWTEAEATAKKSCFSSSILSLKYAITLDGKIAASSVHASWISRKMPRSHVFELRGRSDAVIVGGNTVRMDNPRLTARHGGGHLPMRIVMSQTLNLPDVAHLWDVADVPTVVATQ